MHFSSSNSSHWFFVSSNILRTPALVSLPDRKKETQICYMFYIDYLLESSLLLNMIDILVVNKPYGDPQNYYYLVPSPNLMTYF